MAQLHRQELAGWPQVLAPLPIVADFHGHVGYHAHRALEDAAITPDQRLGHFVGFMVWHAEFQSYPLHGMEGTWPVTVPA